MRVLVFGAHPDDMEIGMGGTIVKHVTVGDEILMVVATVPSRRETRLREAREGAEVLGARLEILDVPPDELGMNRRTIRECDRLFATVDPHLVYTHWDHDSHQDHMAVSQAVIAAGRRNRCSLLMYEQTIPGGVVSGPGFKAQSFVDISPYIDRKCQGILVHQSQIEQNGGDWWLDGVRGRAMYRGYQMNVRYAEAFEVVKAIDVQFGNGSGRAAAPRNVHRKKEKHASDTDDAPARAHERAMGAPPHGRAPDR
jgi:LmbE family N-acetylglucosaminyl deacetylase